VVVALAVIIAIVLRTFVVGTYLIPSGSMEPTLMINDAAHGRDPATLRKVLLWTPVETVLTSIAQFDELAAPYEELGFDQLVLHHPQQTGPYRGSLRVFEQIAARAGGSEGPRGPQP
jgi:hypothetical protein